MILKTQQVFSAGLKVFLKNPVATELSRWNNRLNSALRKAVLQEGYLGMSFGLKSLKTQIWERKTL
jgi:hypothetical protein